MAKNRTIIESRISELEILLRDSLLTPLLRARMRRALSLHCEAQKAPNLNPYLTELNALQDVVDEHWKRVNKSMILAARLQQSMMVFRVFLGSKLLEDYANQPYIPESDMVAFAERVLAQGSHFLTSSADKDNVVFPLEEMIMNQQHVDNRMQAAVGRGGKPGSDLQPLIDRCDWANLAFMLANDRELASRLLEQKGIAVFEYQMIFKGVDKAQGKYFTELKSPSAFILNEYSRGLSARQCSTHATAGFGAGRQSTAYAPKSSFAWIHNAFPSALTGTKSSPEAETALLLWDDETSRIHSKKIQ